MRRRLYKPFTKMMAVSVSLSLALSTAAFAQEGGGSAADQASAEAGTAVQHSLKTGFPDVPSTHWAQKYITKLALLGVIRGDGAGRFNPNMSVKQQDVIIMAVNMMGLADEVSESKETVVLPFEVDAYAKPYVALAIDKGLIHVQEELSAAGENSAKSWGAKEATRQWVAKVTIRALGKQAEAAELANTPTDFKDNADIASWALGYINEAVQLNIVSGFEDGSFKPNGKVTRAEMATFLSRAEPYMGQHSARVATGAVSDITGSKIRLLNDQGQEKEFALHSDTVYYSYKDNVKRISLSDVKPYYEVYVIQEQGTAYYVEITDEQSSFERIEGTLVVANPDDLQIVVMVDNKPKVFDLASTVAVTDKDGKNIPLGALVKDSRIEIVRNELISGGKALKIAVKEVPVNKTVEGTVTSVDSAENKVTVEETESGNSETFTVVSGQYDIRYGDKVLSGIGDLNTGDKVKIEVKNSQVASITVLKSVVQKDSGTLESVLEDNKTIVIRKDGMNLAAYDIANGAEVVIEGLDYAGLGDLEAGDAVQLQINADNKVSKITVTNRNIENNTQLTIVDYNEENKLLILKDDKGKNYLYEVTSKTDIDFNGSSVDLNSFSSVFRKDRKVNITVSGSKLLSVQFAGKYDGTITQIGTTSRTIAIKTDNNRTMSFTYLSNPEIEIFNRSSASINDLKVGDDVQLILDADQERVAKIVLKQKLLFKTAGKSGTTKLTVNDINGSTYEFTIDGNVALSYANKTRASFDDIRIDEPVTIGFAGKTVQSVTLLDAFRGKVKSVDETDGKLTIEDYEKGTQTVRIGKNVKIDTGNNVTGSLAVIKPDDRVELAQDADGNTIIFIASPQTKTFWTYDSENREISFKRTTFTDQYQYKLHTKAYVHKGDQTITPASLRDGDQVKVYLLNDKIVELEKLN